MGKNIAGYNNIPFFDYIDMLNGANEAYNKFGNNYPNTNYKQMKKNDFKRLICNNVYDRLLNITLRMYKWTLPDTFDDRAIELGYLMRGFICVFKSKLGDFALPCIPQNLYNIYGNPTLVQVVGFNGYTEKVKVLYKTDIPTKMTSIDTEVIESDIAQGVFSRDNYLGYQYIKYIDEYALKIADKICALNVATQRLKCPFIYAIDDVALKDTYDDLLDKIESNDDLVVRVRVKKISGDKIEESFQPVPNNMRPEIIQAIKDSILFDFNMFLETIGINTNPSPDKSQVVLTTEINSNNSLIELENDVRLSMRQKLCEDAKQILGIEMKVEKNINEVNKMIDEFRKGVEDDGAREEPATTG